MTGITQNINKTHVIWQKFEKRKKQNYYSAKNSAGNICMVNGIRNIIYRLRKIKDIISLN
jgi:hypothetical protein